MRMNTIIIYGSCYGTTKVYAEALAEQMGLTAMPYNRTGNLSGYQRIIYLGGLYAGGVKGLVKTVKKIDPAVCGRFVVITVGLADPDDKKNVENIRKAALRQISEALAGKTEFYHLRGGIDYGKLGLKHRIMMKMLYEQAKKQPAEEQDADTKALIATYGQKVSFVDPDRLKMVVKELEE